MKDAKDFPAPRCKTFAQNIGNKENAQNVFHFFIQNWRILKTGMHGFLQNCARPKKVCKKTSETITRQSSLGVFSAPLHKLSGVSEWLITFTLSGRSWVHIFLQWRPLSCMYFFKKEGQSFSTNGCVFVL